MKKISLLFFLTTLLALPFCTTSKSAMGDKKKQPTVYYVTDVAPIIAERCTPCHFPAKDGKKMPLDTYEALRDNVDYVLSRVTLPHNDPKFMPFKMKKEPLSDSLINVIKLWKEEGMAFATINR